MSQQPLQQTTEQKAPNQTPTQLPAKKLTVVQVLPALNGGGVETGTLEIADALIAAGHRSIVVSKGGRLVQPLEKSGSTHIQWDLGKKSLLTLRHIPKLRQWLLQLNADIIHVRSRLPAWLIYLAWKSLPANKRPHLVSTVHGLHSVSRYSGIMNCGERVIVVSKTLQQFQLDNYPQTDPRKLRLIYRGIDPQRYYFGYQPNADWLAKWRQAFPSLEQQPIIITLPGRITRLKGHQQFIELIYQLRQQDIPAMGLIVGEADAKHQSYLQELKQQINAYQLNNAIVFTGHRSDMREIYSQSSLVLSLSNKPESFGRTTLEALSLGIPVVGYDHGGVGEILTTLFPQGAVTFNDQQQLLAQVTRVLEQPEPVLPNQHFLLSQMKAQTLAVYQELCQ